MIIILQVNRENSRYLLTLTVRSYTELNFGNYNILSLKSNFFAKTLHQGFSDLFLCLPKYISTNILASVHGILLTSKGKEFGFATHLKNLKDLCFN